MNNRHPIVITSTGALSGACDAQTGQCTFFGIPYAEPPLGPLRFKPTVPKRPWNGVRDARHFGFAGPQKFDPTEGSYAEFADTPPVKNQKWVGSEDNLTLNIWSPAIDDKKRPVLVWIHGGANYLESSRLAAYHGDSLVDRGDIVFVSLNYRLGIFGFLDLSVIGGSEYAGSHSNGVRDQITALRWIQQNIENFGGDAENITVMGESAGSIDISWLLTNGMLNGIATRVVMMSGVAGLVGLSGDVRTGFSEACGQRWARDFLERIHIQSMGALLDLSTAQIMDRIMQVVEKTDTLTYMDSLFWPRVSPDFASVDPFHAAAKGGGRGIDVIIGHTGYEMGLWLFWDQELDQRPCKWSAEKIIDLTPALQADAIKLYEKIFTHEPVGVRGMHLIGDSIFTMPTLWFADEVSRHGNKVWMYQFNRETNLRQRAPHASDQTYLFNKHDTQSGRSLVGIPVDAQEKESRLQLTAAMQDAFLAFARNGDPNMHNNTLLPAWPLYEVEHREVMSFNVKSEILKDPARERREWWYKNIYRPALGS